MKRYICKTMRIKAIALTLALSAVLMLGACTISEEQLAEKVKSAIVDDEKANDRQLEVTEFDLGQKQGTQYKSVLKGKLDGQEVIYDVVITDEGNDFDVDWDKRR